MNEKGLKQGIILNNRYRIDKSVAVGGYFITYIARDLITNANVSINEYLPMDRNADCRVGIEQFICEATTIKRFNCPNVINILDIFEENNTAYVVREYFEGLTLSSYLCQENGKIDYKDAIEIISEVIDALIIIHSQKAVHRDVSPDNIYLGEGKNVKLVDFSSVIILDKFKEQISKNVMLRPGYTAIEQYSDKMKIDQRTDVYSLAATMYRMVTGLKPDDVTSRLINDEVVSPHMIIPEIPQHVSDAIMKGMSLTVNSRFKNVSAFREALLGKEKKSIRDIFTSE